MTMLWLLMVLFAAFAGLIYGADKLVAGSLALATRWQVSAACVGFTIVAFGTSLPELVISTMAALRGAPALAVGNVVGSNIANLSLILGLGLVYMPQSWLKVNTVSQWIILNVLTGISGWLLWDHVLSRFEAALLLAALVGYLVWSFWQGGTEEEMDVSGTTHPWVTFLWGLVLLVISGQAVIYAATALGMQWGFSEWWIGVFILALGTSLPEVATTLSALKAQQGALALGNILGSNILNLVAVLGSSAFIAPMEKISPLLRRDYLGLVGLTVILTGYFLYVRRGRRVLGVMLILGYVIYIGQMVL